MDIKPELILSQLPGSVIIKNLSNTFLWGNEKFLKTAGLKTLSKLEGLSDYDAPWAKYAQSYLSHDLDTAKGLMYKVIDPLPCKDRFKIMLCSKTPYKNEQGEVVGILGMLTELKSPDILTISKLLGHKNLFKDGKSIVVSDNNYIQSRTNKLKLTTRETECLFYLIRGGTRKTIAKQLNLSPRTIDAHTEQIKLKFGCHHKAQLIELAIEDGFYHFIPDSVINKHQILII